MNIITHDQGCPNCGYNLRGLLPRGNCPECGKGYDIDDLLAPGRPRRGRLNAFDKTCAVLAMIVAALLMLLGVIGTFAGCSANFMLPPILGALPALVAWGIIKPVIVAWRVTGDSG
jgi:hypothetical protein